MSRFSKFVLHVCAMCSIVCIAARVLDWYNPYMDFTGHISLIQIVLYVAVLVVAVTAK